MFKLHAIQAKFGDCLLVEWGSGGNRRFMLIDGGPPNTFGDDLDAALNQIVGNGGKIDLVVLSHVDNDHVVGLLDLLAALEADEAGGQPRRLDINRFWHNSFQRSIDPDGEITQRLQMLMNIAGSAGVMMPFATDAFLGVKEGNRLRTLAAQLGFKMNEDFGGEVITVESAKKEIKLGQLVLRIVGPTRENLEELRKKWLAWLAKTEAQVAKNPSTAANADKSVPNLSSIVIHAECDGKTMLLTGDARGDHIEQGLKTAKLSKNGRLHVDVLKVQHHGSDRNVNASFFERITADTYVISADGKHGNPDYATLAWIVQGAAKAKRKIKIFVTNETPSTQKLKKTLSPTKYGYALEIKPVAAHALAIPVTGV